MAPKPVGLRTYPWYWRAIILLFVFGATDASAQHLHRGIPSLAPGLQQNEMQPSVPGSSVRDALISASAVSLLDERERDRNDAMINGALVVVGALGIFDNVVNHWILGLHRAIEGSPHTLEVEIGFVAVSTATLAAGIVRERRARRR